MKALVYDPTAPQGLRLGTPPSRRVAGKAVLDVLPDK